MGSANVASVPVASPLSTSGREPSGHRGRRLELYDPSGTKVAQATSMSAEPESITYAMPAGATGNHTLRVVSKDHAAPYTLSSGYPVAVHADLTLNLKDPAGATVATARAANGSAGLSHQSTAGGTTPCRSSTTLPRSPPRLLPAVPPLHPAGRPVAHVPTEAEPASTATPSTRTPKRHTDLQVTARPVLEGASRAVFLPLLRPSSKR